MWHDHHIDFAMWLHPAMWHVALESLQWIHQVAAHCSVICGSSMTCRWIRRWRHPAMLHVALGTWHWIRQVAAPCNVAGSCGITCHGIPPNRPPYWNSTSGFDSDHIIAVDMSFCTSLRNFIQIGPPSAEKMTSCRFSRWRISAILDFMGPIMGSLKSLRRTSYRSSIETMALNCLVFLENRGFVFRQQTDRRTDGQHRCTKPLSLSRAAA